MSDKKEHFKKHVENKPIRTPKTMLRQSSRLKSDSLGALEELVQCGICLEKLSDPRMLPCQHTFCLACLQTLLTAKNLIAKPDMKYSVSRDIKSINCPMCQRTHVLDDGLRSLDSLPKNFYIDSLLKLLAEDKTPTSTQAASASDYRCIKCQTVSDGEEHVCQHCMQIFCSICWQEHISELDSKLDALVRQIDDSKMKLKHKSYNFANRCDLLVETIETTIKEKIEELKKMEGVALEEVKLIKEQGKVIYEMIDARADSLKEKILVNINDAQVRTNKISTYMNVRKETARLLEEINHYGEGRVMFDPEKVKIEQDEEGIYNDILDSDNLKHTLVENPYESVASMINYYKNRSFTPKLIWTKCPRPGGVAIPPWDTTKIYVAATDTNQILILDRSKFKLIGRITYPDMLCPTNLAFCETSEEMFVTDKWKHCIHVFSNENEYMRTLNKPKLRSPDGIAMGPDNNLIVCDTGNNRVVTIDPESGTLLGTIGTNELHMPTSVAVHGTNIMVADTGDNKIKIFNTKGVLLREIGRLGRNKGEFRSAEVVAVDCLGFIHVGDAGNARIQVFQPDGSLVRILGSKEGFGWISGVYVTPELDIITTDSRSRSLRIF
ncbi:unnamed protein product [Phaedon cochleariae]|uniref:RING-type domain-containing protein n=1 Tax=Phaedon cochleariae TaxID=80249 RepID=A0A9N9SGL1_PHACE|nr:unnamed protein product [Phaedon cochleariae]